MIPIPGTLCLFDKGEDVVEMAPSLDLMVSTVEHRVPDMEP